MYKYLFGPVPSRRLGMSLGVDLVPKKVCSLDCVYCEVGRTNKLTLERKEYIPAEKIKRELADYFSKHPLPDYVTLTGSGEPTLNTRIGDIIEFVKQLQPGIPVAVLTNGTLLSDRDVRESLLKADLIVPSLDAASEDVMQAINCPASGFDIEKYIEGLVAFSQEFKGKIWLEVFILPGYNDSEQELAEIKKIIQRINPDRVQLNTLDRPGTVSGLRPATAEELNRITASWGMEHVEIIAASAQRKQEKAYRDDVESAILGTIARRPCTLEDLPGILGLPAHEIKKYLDVLVAEKKVETEKLERGVFYKMREN